MSKKKTPSNSPPITRRRRRHEPHSKLNDLPKSAFRDGVSPLSASYFLKDTRYEIVQFRDKRGQVVVEQAFDISGTNSVMALVCLGRLMFNYDSHAIRHFDVDYGIVSFDANRISIRVWLSCYSNDDSGNPDFDADVGLQVFLFGP